MASLVMQELDRFGPAHCEPLTYAQASAYTADLTARQYENFTVVSRLLPRWLRDDFRHVYSFCRWADDLGDEAGTPARALELLQWWQHELDLCYADHPRHPIFVALRHTITKHDLPREPFDHLIDAFVQDQHLNRYDTWEQLLDYCTRSANPVGRLVLMMCGYRDHERFILSDATCTALQLVNFWQDVRRDVLERDRVYIPSHLAAAHQLDLKMMVSAIRADAQQQCETGCQTCNLPSTGLRVIQTPFTQTMRDLMQRTQVLFDQGRALWPLVRADMRLNLQLFSMGGQAVMHAIRRQHYNTLHVRPALSKFDKLKLMMRALIGKMFTANEPAPTTQNPTAI